MIELATSDSICYKQSVWQWCPTSRGVLIMSISNKGFRTPKECSTGGVFNCVAVKVSPKGVAIRDTKDTSKSTLKFSRDEWKTFVKAVKQGEFDV